MWAIGLELLSQSGHSCHESWSYAISAWHRMQHKPVYRAVHRQGKGGKGGSSATPLSKGRQTLRHLFAACQGAHEPCTHSQKLSDSSRLTTSSSKKPSTASLNLSGAERGCVRQWAWQVFTPAWLERWVEGSASG